MMKRRTAAGLLAMVAGTICVADPAAGAQPVSAADYIVEVASGVKVSQVLDIRLVKSRLSGPAFKGAIVELSAAEARALVGQSSVVSVSRNDAVTVSRDALAAGEGRGDAVDLRNVLSWGLDRSDDRLGLDSDYTPPADGAGVDAYIIDTGINVDHPEFAGRTGPGMDAVGDGRGTADCHGHGTHVAGTIASNKYGMASSATVHPVRVLDCEGSGTYADVIEGINWVAANHRPHSVANLSLGGYYNAAVNNAVNALVDAGIPVAVAAGNSGDDACSYSPASAAKAMTVGAVDSSDSDTSFSNYGTCLDLYAPGQGITSTDYEDPSKARRWSGTSMASPHVAGAMGVIWSVFPDLTAQQVIEAVRGQATADVLNFPNGQLGSPNRLVNVQFATSGPPTPPVTPSPGPTTPTPTPSPSTPVTPTPTPIVDPPDVFPRVPWIASVNAKIRNRTARVQWVAVDAKAFDIQLKRKHSPWSEVSQVPTTQTQIKGLRKSTTYWFRVRGRSGTDLVGAYSTLKFTTG